MHYSCPYESFSRPTLLIVLLLLHSHNDYSSLPHSLFDMVSLTQQECTDHVWLCLITVDNQHRIVPEGGVKTLTLELTGCDGADTPCQEMCFSNLFKQKKLLILSVSFLFTND